MKAFHSNRCRGHRRPPIAMHGLVVGLVALCLCSCASPSFSRAYRQSVADYAAADPKPEVAGPWEGYWKSDVNGHTGKLRAVATAPSAGGSAPAATTTSTGKDPYEFRYHATWAKVLSGGYTADHQVQRQSDGRYSLRAEKELGMIGKYVSEGIIDGDSLESTYRADADRGVFVLKRPQ